MSTTSSKNIKQHKSGKSILYLILYKNQKQKGRNI
jgi:hypothetical protein